MEQTQQRLEVSSGDTRVRPPQRRFTGLAALALVAVTVAALHLGVLAVRTTNTIRKGSFVETTGAEVAPIYGVWKARHGHPVYEPPFRAGYAFSLYNFGFYYGYGWLARVAGLDGDALVLGARLLTLVTCIASAGLFASLLARIGRADLQTDLSVWYVAAAGLVTWLSSSVWSWFSVTVRSDAASMVCAFAGLWCVLRVVGTLERSGALLASVLFFAAWAFKQSTVGIFAGACLYTAIRVRAFGLLTALVLPFVVLVGTTLLLGGEAYRLNVVTLPTVARFDHLKEAWLQLAQVLVTHPYIWVVPGLWASRSRSRVRPGTRTASTSPRTIEALGWIAVVSFLWCLAALNRDGSYTNTLLEFFLTASLLSLALLPRAMCGPWEQDSTARSAMLLASLAAAGVFPAVQLALPDRLGNQTVASWRDVEAARAVAEVMQRLPKPVFVEEGMLALPWFSTDGRYPALVVDNYLYFAVRAAGRLEDDGLEGVVQSRRFPSLLLTGASRLESTAENAGYEKLHLSLPASDSRFRLYGLPADAGAHGSPGPSDD